MKSIVRESQAPAKFKALQPRVKDANSIKPMPHDWKILGRLYIINFSSILERIQKFKEKIETVKLKAMTIMA